MRFSVLTLALTILLEYGVYLVWIRREPAKLLLYAVLTVTALARALPLSWAEQERSFGCSSP